MNEFAEQSRDSLKRMQGNVIWTTEITDDFEKNEYRPTNFQNIRKICGKQDEKYCSEFKN